MKVFVDECVNFKLLRHLTGHTFVHVRDTPFRGMKNGVLLRAVAPDHEIFLTLDKDIPYQQNLKKFPMAFVIMRPVSNDITDLLPLVPDLLATLERIAEKGYAPGELCEIAPEQT
jgi:predicted nuclease of predicted toxin-antitoxin system